MALRQVLTTPAGMEYSVHEVPKTHVREIRAIFPDIADLGDMLVVPTCQQSRMELVNTGDDVEEEKDELLETFAAWAGRVCEALSAQGYWCDYIDPCSGLPMLHTQYRQPYSEVDGLVTLLKYQVANAGCCKVVLHPKWGSSVYPATMFAKAPKDAVFAAIDSVNQRSNIAA